MLNATDFHGVSGHLRFIGPSRVSVTEVKQWRLDGNETGYHVVGRFFPDNNIPEGGRYVIQHTRGRHVRLRGKRTYMASTLICALGCVIEYFLFLIKLFL